MMNQPLLEIFLSASKHACLYIRNEHLHRFCVAEGHKIAALMKKRKEEILRNKEQSTEQFIEQSRELSAVQSTVQSNNTYIYGVGIVAILAINFCLFLYIIRRQDKS